MMQDRPMILVVDDEEDLTWSIKRGLKKENPEYQIVCVNSGSDALSLLNQNHVTLLITDLRMPECSGLDLLKRAFKSSDCPKTLLMTAYGASDPEASQAAELADAYLEKPFDMKTLRSLVKTMLSTESPVMA